MRDFPCKNKLSFVKKKVAQKQKKVEKKTIFSGTIVSAVIEADALCITHGVRSARLFSTHAVPVNANVNGASNELDTF